MGNDIYLLSFPKGNLRLWSVIFSITYFSRFEQSETESIGQEINRRKTAIIRPFLSFFAGNFPPFNCTKYYPNPEIPAISSVICAYYRQRAGKFLVRLYNISC